MSIPISVNLDPEGDLLNEIYLQVLSDQGVCAFIVTEESRRIVSVNDILCSILDKDPSSIMDGTVELLLGEIAGAETNIMQRQFEINNSSYSIFSFKHAVHGEQNLEKDILMRDVFYRGVVESVPDAVLTIDKKGIITVWNRAAEDLFGWTAQEAVGRSVDQLVRSVNGQDEISANEIINGKVIRAFECIRRGKEDTEKKVSVSVSPIVVHGENVGAVGVYKDLSHRESIQKRLEENEIKFRAITETAQDAVIIIDSDSRVSFFNSSAELMFGYKRSETLGRKLHHLIAPESYWEMIEMGLKQFRETGKGIMVGRVVEMEGRRKNGSVFPVELSVSSFFMNGGWQATGILRDISERKGIELELIEAREAALNAARTQSEFLANMSHEIRTPLNAIIGTTDLMLETELTSSQKNLLRLSRNASDNLLNIVNDILDISKVEAGKIELERIPFDLHEDFEKTCETLSLRAHEKKLEFICRIYPETPRWVLGDSPRLKQVLINLIGNAVKFTSHGEIIVEAKPYDQGRISFSVTDTGIGIPPGKVESIFMSFTQADSSHTRKYGGTGLGLAISTRLVELMGGSLSVQSQVDSGSTFTFYCDLPEIDSMSLPEKFEKCDLSGKQILVVDDNNNSRLLLKELLEDDGASVHIADGGTSALDMIRGSQYDAILLDCSMPELDGFATTEKMKKNSIDSSEIIMMLTTDNSDEQIKKCESLGVEHYLYKPLRRSHLRKQVMSVVEGFSVPSDPASFSVASKYSIEEMHLSVLLAEDSPDNRFLILKYTEAFPWEITVAENGREALDHFMERKFDLILMDMQMPVMDGYEATRSIRAHEAMSMSNHTPIVALTAHALKDEVKKCLSAGCDIHISKPIRKKDLIERLDDLLRIMGSREGSPDLSEDMQQSEILVLNQTEAVEKPSDTITQGPVAYVPEDLEPLIPGYIANRRSDIINIRQLVSQENYTEAQRLAHSMKGSGGGYGFEEITKLGASMEIAAKSCSGTEILSGIDELEHYLDTVSIQYVDDDE